MADYYTQFSETLKLKGKQAVAWVDTYLDQFDGDAVNEGDPNYDERMALAMQYDIDPYWLQLDFQCETSQDEKGKPYLWIYAEESGNVDQVAVFVQTYLKKFEPNGSFSLSWGSTCSKMRTDGFGGGAIFVTAERIQHMYTGDWLHQKQKDFDRKLKKAKAAKAS